MVAGWETVEPLEVGRRPISGSVRPETAKAVTILTPEPRTSGRGRKVSILLGPPRDPPHRRLRGDSDVTPRTHTAGHSRTSTSTPMAMGSTSTSTTRTRSNWDWLAPPPSPTPTAASSSGCGRRPRLGAQGFGAPALRLLRTSTDTSPSARCGVSLFETTKSSERELRVLLAEVPPTCDSR
jgi:hypothetical protein